MIFFSLSIVIAVLYLVCVFGSIWFYTMILPSIRKAVILIAPITNQRGALKLVEMFTVITIIGFIALFFYQIFVLIKIRKNKK